MDGVLPAALAAAEHVGAAGLIQYYQALTQAAERDREQEIANSRRSRL
jgi:hypothetical protein